MNYSLMTMIWWLFIKYFPSGKQSCLFIVKFCSPRQMLVVFYPFNFQLNSQNQLKHFRPSVPLSNFLPRNFPSFLRHSHRSKGWIIFFIINNSRCCNNFLVDFSHSNSSINCRLSLVVILSVTRLGIPKMFQIMYMLHKMEMS